MPGKEKSTMREEVLLALNTKFPVMRRMFSVKKIGLFGSVARGEDRPESDVDIEVEFEQGLDTYENYIGLSFYLDELLGRRVDLVTTRVLAMYLRPELGAEYAVLSRDLVYLSQMLEEISFLHQRARGMTEREFSRDEIARRAVVRSLEIIGESASRVSPAFMEQHPEIAWKELEGLKSRLVHPYFSMDWPMIWNVMGSYLPATEQKLRRLQARLSH
jgi:hypothetical protein